MCVQIEKKVIIPEYKVKADLAAFAYTGLRFN